MTIKNVKVSIIGAGSIGGQTASNLMQCNVASEIVIINRNRNKAEGKAIDISHGAALFGNTRVRSGSYEDIKDSHIVAITVGQVAGKNGSRLDVLKDNIEIYKSIICNIIKYNKDCIIVLVTNPVDIMAYTAFKLSSFPSNHIIGTGTLLDTSRLKYFIGDYYDINSSQIETCVIGEHGDSQVALWSQTKINNIPIKDYIKKFSNKNFDEKVKGFLENKTKRAGWDIRDCDEHSCFGISMCLSKIIEAIILDKKIVLPISTFFKGEYDISDIFMGTPAVLGKNGVEKIVKLPISPSEIQLLHSSALNIKNYISSIENII
ncbi:L-lactate dehydrogenase [Clostridium drakei]|uniref:L-lactate dehydrogenase n=1 Tax=Clostridium drakei TaxID=332101 RepID=A0A2U8DTP5_9CLOT|nr:L-lactate dehydrogenase [Clostridium drakei]AWI05452.1 L-lactate dehydrogenase [Clostridium drakei]